MPILRTEIQVCKILATFKIWQICFDNQQRPRFDLCCYVRVKECLTSTSTKDRPHRAGLPPKINEASHGEVHSFTVCRYARPSRTQQTAYIRPPAYHRQEEVGMNLVFCKSSRFMHCVDRASVQSEPRFLPSGTRKIQFSKRSEIFRFFNTVRLLLKNWMENTPKCHERQIARGWM